MTTSVQMAHTIARQLAGFATTPRAALPAPVSQVTMGMDIIVPV